jgi:hypothetical protein
LPRSSCPAVPSLGWQRTCRLTWCVCMPCPQACVHACAQPPAPSTFWLRPRPSPTPVRFCCVRLPCTVLPGGWSAHHCVLPGSLCWLLPRHWVFRRSILVQRGVHHRGRVACRACVCVCACVCATASTAPTVCCAACWAHSLARPMATGTHSSSLLKPWQPLAMVVCHPSVTPGVLWLLLATTTAQSCRDHILFSFTWACI